MNGKFFLDTNIFVYAVDRAAPAKAAKADKLIDLAIASRRGVVSYQVVQEFFNVAIRKFPRPMSIEESEQYLAAVFRPLLAVHSSLGLFSEALFLQQRYRFGWFDSLMMASALQAGCATFYSEDLQHGFQVGELRVENPFV